MSLVLSAGKDALPLNTTRHMGSLILSFSPIPSLSLSKDTKEVGSKEILPAHALHSSRSQVDLVIREATRKRKKKGKNSTSEASW